MEELKLEAERLMAEKTHLEEQLAATNAKLRKNGDGGGAFIQPGASLTEEDDMATTSDDGKGEATVTEGKKPIEMGDEDFLDFDMVDDEQQEPQQTETPEEQSGNDNSTAGEEKEEETTMAEENNTAATDTSEETKYNNVSMDAFARETIREFRDQLRRDLNMIFPKQLRDPVIKALRPVMKLSVKMGSDAFDMLKRHLLALFADFGMMNKTLSYRCTRYVE